MAIKYGNTTGHSIEKFLESLFAGKHSKLISKGTKTAGAATKAAADALDARAALAPELPKEPGGGADGMAVDAEETPGWPVFCVGAREELKTRGGSLSSEGENAAVQAERFKPIKVLRSLEYSNALTINAIAT
jgi:hypothetical protein